MSGKKGMSVTYLHFDLIIQKPHSSFQEVGLLIHYMNSSGLELAHIINRDKIRFAFSFQL